MSFFELYLITTVLPNISETAAIGLVIGLISLLIGIVGMSAVFDDDDALRAAKTCMKRVLAFVGVCVLIGVFTPGRKALFMMYAGQYVTNSAAVAQLPENAAKALNKLATDYLAEDEEKE